MSMSSDRFPRAPLHAPAPPDFPSLQRPDLVALVEAQLQAAILEGRLVPGARIVEADLARRMGISRAPVREAARRLENAGLLISRPRHGFAVRTISTRQVDELYQVRIDLELLGATLACERASDSQLAELDRRVDHMAQQATQLSQTERVALDMAFHAYLSEISGNQYLHRLFGNMQAEVRLFLALSEASYEDPVYLAETHRPIAAALMRRDAEAARQVIGHHLEVAQAHTRRCVEQVGLTQPPVPPAKSPPPAMPTTRAPTPAPAGASDRHAPEST